MALLPLPRGAPVVLCQGLLPILGLVSSACGRGGYYWVVMCGLLYRGGWQGCSRFRQTFGLQGANRN